MVKQAFRKVANDNDLELDGSIPTLFEHTFHGVLDDHIEHLTELDAPPAAYADALEKAYGKLREKNEKLSILFEYRGQERGQKRAGNPADDGADDGAADGANNGADNERIATGNKRQKLDGVGTQEESEAVEYDSQENGYFESAYFEPGNFDDDEPAHDYFTEPTFNDFEQIINDFEPTDLDYDAEYNIGFLAQFLMESRRDDEDPNDENSDEEQ